jgi:Rrf2 family transcriptional regulator, iron-sulfur cluster assembly transcription factor
MFSKSCEYAIRAVVYIAGQSLNGRRCSIADVAGETGSPEAFAAKILQTLSRNKLITSAKGPGGGFEMSKQKMKSLTLADIVDTIDGDSVYSGCALGLRRCDEVNPCPLHNRFKKVRTELQNILETTSIYHLAMNVEKGIGVLKI